MGQYIEGLTKIPKPIPAEKIREQRELEEKQRAMERKIRALKRKVEGTQDEKKVKEYKRKLREEQGKLREFIKEHDDVLRRDYSRRRSTAVRVSRSRQLRERKKRLLKLPIPKAKILFRQIKSLIFLSRIITFLNRKITFLSRIITKIQ